LGPASAAPGPAAPPASTCPRQTSRSATPRTPGPCANPPPVDSRSRQNEKPRPGQPLTVYCRGMFEVPLDGLKEGICAVGPVTAEPSKPRPEEKQERRQCAQPGRGEQRAPGRGRRRGLGPRRRPHGNQAPGDAAPGG